MSRGKLKTLLPFLLLLLLLASLVLAQPLEKATILKIIDGDTFWVNFQGKEQKVRLIGMDTPEVGYNWKTKSDMKKSGKDLKTIVSQGKEASKFVKKFIKKLSITRAGTWEVLSWKS